MILASVSRILRLPKVNVTPLYCAVPVNHYAAPGPPAGLGKLKKGKKGTIGVEKIVLPVETDTHKLVKYVCGSNICKEGQDVEIKPDSEYPDWLWNVYTGPPKKLEDLDPNTKAYWRKLRQLGLIRNNKKAAHKQF